MGKLVGCVVAIVGQMQDKVDPRFEKVEEDVASWGGSRVLMSCQKAFRCRRGFIIIRR